MRWMVSLSTTLLTPWRKKIAPNTPADRAPSQLSHLGMSNEKTETATRRKPVPIMKWRTVSALPPVVMLTMKAAGNDSRTVRAPTAPVIDRMVDVLSGWSD